MDNFNTTDMENYAAKMDEKYSDRSSDKLGFKEFKEAFAEAVEKEFGSGGTSDIEIENRLVDKVNETYDAFTVKYTDSDVGVNISINDAYDAYVRQDVSIEELTASAVARTAEALQNAPVISNSNISGYSKEEMIFYDRLVKENSHLILELASEREFQGKEGLSSVESKGKSFKHKRESFDECRNRLFVATSGREPLDDGLLSTAYIEFYPGEWDGESFWNAASMNLAFDLFVPDIIHDFVYKIIGMDWKDLRHICLIYAKLLGEMV